MRSKIRLTGCTREPLNASANEVAVEHRLAHLARRSLKIGLTSCGVSARALRAIASASMSTTESSLPTGPKYLPTRRAMNHKLAPRRPTGAGFETTCAGSTSDAGIADAGALASPSADDRAASIPP